MSEEKAHDQVLMRGRVANPDMRRTTTLLYCAPARVQCAQLDYTLYNV